MQLQWISMACIVVYVTLWTDILVGLLRLRKCSPETYRPELKGGVSVVRELHVYPWRQCCWEFLSVMHRINTCMAWTNFMNKFIKQCHRKNHSSHLSIVIVLVIYCVVDQVTAGGFVRYWHITVFAALVLNLASISIFLTACHVKKVR